jgi:hypothetical protein
MFVVFLVMFVVTAVISWFWVRGIDYMQKNHPDYKGEDFLSTSAGRDHWDEWDDNTIHAEGDF